MRPTDSGSSRATRSDADREWLLSAARLLGRAARLARIGANRIVGAARVPARRGASRGAGEIARLVRRLAQIVSAHSAQGPASLARDPAFWTTVERLAALRAALILERTTSAASGAEIDAGTRTEFETLPSIAEKPEADDP